VVLWLLLLGLGRGWALKIPGMITREMHCQYPCAPELSGLCLSTLKYICQQVVHQRTHNSLLNTNHFGLRGCAILGSENLNRGITAKYDALPVICNKDHWDSGGVAPGSSIITR